MTPLPVNPTVIVNIIDGQIVAVASNVATDLKVVQVGDWQTFSKEARNRPFKDITPNTNPEN